MKVVLDTNIFISALMSKNGASNAILSYVGTNIMLYALSVPLVLEYESVAKRHIGGKINYTEAEIDEILVTTQPSFLP